jgi:YD repeat-containing protein
MAKWNAARTKPQSQRRHRSKAIGTARVNYFSQRGKTLASIEGLGSSGYSYRLKTGETLTFNPPNAVASGRVTNWNSPSGASVNFSYNDDGKLQSVTNPATQRQLNLHYVLIAFPQASCNYPPE